ncbi:MAG: sulfate ABC transporter substrate-binding protein [Tepidisphaeraceae bacterium]
MNRTSLEIVVSSIAAALILIPGVIVHAALLNVSYDPTRELYEDLNGAFATHYKQEAGKSIEIQQSHGGSGKQARAVIEGLQADVVTLGLAGDINAIQKAGLINPGWQQHFPDHSSPYTSTIVFLVRKGNPHQIKDWPDLIKPGVKVITANPKSSGGARWNFLAAWGYAAGLSGHDLSKPGAAGAISPGDSALDNEKAKAFVTALYKNVPVLDSGARGATVTFAQKNVGDVLITWENEAFLAQEEFGADKFETVYPSVSILAEPPVAIVDKNVDAHGTRADAEAYLKFLYTPEAQEIIAQDHYRPRDTAILAKHAGELKPIPLFTINEAFGGWSKAQPHFFDDGGVFDQIYKS